ncbi:MAG: glycosyltransferase family 39 protein [Chloroflexi bacterium]|nr:glycosyltransferase family 39 protein [Chloroflexota bacterium]
MNLIHRAADYISAHTYLFLTLIAVLTWLIGILVLRSTPPDLHNGETVSWWGLTLNLVHGYGYSLCNQYYFPFCNASIPYTAMREPAPVLLFAAVALLFKESLLAASLTELMLHIGIVIALFYLTREWAGPSTGLLAALAWAIYPRVYILIPQVSGDLLAGLGVTVGIYFVMRARRTDHICDWLLAGLGLGIAVMSRSAMSMVALTVIAGCMIERWELRQRIWSWLRPALFVAAMVGVSIAPWLIYTDVALGRPLIGSSLVGYNIYRHNFTVATNNYLHYVGNDEGWAAIQALLARRTDLRGTENEAQMDVIYRQEGLKIIAANPVHYVLLSAYRFFMLWFDWQVSVGFGYPMGLTEYSLAALQAILLILAFVGSRNNLRRTWPLWASLIMVTLAYMAVDSRMLYIGPVMPLVISLSAAGAARLMQKFTTSATISRV